MAKRPMLEIPRGDRPFRLYTDYCSDGVGAVLTQLDEFGIERVVEFASRSLKGAECTYGSYEGEVLALIWALEYFSHYLLYQTFDVYTDNAAVKWLFSASKVTPKIARWISYISQFTFRILHVTGTKNPADGFSRLPVDTSPKSVSE